MLIDEEPRLSGHQIIEQAKRELDAQRRIEAAIEFEDAIQTVAEKRREDLERAQAPVLAANDRELRRAQLQRVVNTGTVNEALRAAHEIGLMAGEDVGRQQGESEFAERLATGMREEARLRGRPEAEVVDNAKDLAAHYDALTAARRLPPRVPSIVDSKKPMQAYGVEAAHELGYQPTAPGWD